MTNNTTPDVPAIAALREDERLVASGEGPIEPRMDAHDRLLDALPALLDAAERCAFLEKALEQALKLGEIGYEPNMDRIVGGEQCGGWFLVDEANKAPDLAVYLRSKSPATDAGQENGV